MKEFLHQSRRSWLISPQQQAILNQTVKKAKEYDNDYKETCVDSAACFRLPYRDIAMPRNSDDSKSDPKSQEARRVAVGSCRNFQASKYFM